MPGVRLFGNAVLSLLAKLSTGYWHVFDPTNGYTAIHARVAQRLPFGKINRRYFFETDILFRLNTIRAVVVDIPMDALYGDEKATCHWQGDSASFSSSMPAKRASGSSTTTSCGMSPSRPSNW